MKPLSLDAQRNPEQHQYFQGMKNVCYLAGYVRRQNPHVVPDGAIRQFWLQLTNNENLMLPVTLPQGVEFPKRIQDQQGLKCICSVRGWRNEKDEPQLRVFARSFSRINALEMPALTSFEKAVRADVPETKGFKPFGSGYRNSGASNKVEIAGIVSAKRYRPASGEKGPAIIMLLRQTADPRQDIPVIYYGKLAEKISEDIPVGAPIFVTGRYRMTNLTPTGDVNPETGKPFVVATPLIMIDVPTQPIDRDILYIEDIVGSRVRWKEKTPDWVFEVATKRPRATSAVQGAAGEQSATPVGGERQLPPSNLQLPASQLEAVGATPAAQRPVSPLSDEDRRALGLGA